MRRSPQHHPADDMEYRRTCRRILAIFCLVLLLGILYAGLTPFHVPANQVEWIAGLNAVRFGEYGTILGSGSFDPWGAGQDGRTLEFWIQPGKIEASNTLFTFYDPAVARHAAIHQTSSDLEVVLEPSAAWHPAGTEKFYVDNAFRDGKSAFWAVIFGPAGTAVYRNGSLIRTASLKPSADEMRGRLIVGNSPIFNDSWSGVLRGLAIYDKALDAPLIAKHYATWTEKARPMLDPAERCIALYLFSEHDGRVVHNALRSGKDLYIPPKYTVINQTVLDPVWRAFDWSAGFWKDAIVNVAGFVPFALFFCAYFEALDFYRPRRTAVLFCCAVSACIEFTQTQLPTRDSSMADLINNTFGSILGAAAYRGAKAEAIRRGILTMARRIEN